MVPICYYVPVYFIYKVLLHIFNMIHTLSNHLMERRSKLNIYLDNNKDISLEKTHQMQGAIKEMDHILNILKKHKQAEKIMKETGSGGFPTIAIHCKQRGFGKYEGPRTAKAMIAACSCNSVKSSDTNPQIIKVSNKENPIESAKTVCRETGKGVLICLLADWCGHCKRLKESGELDKVAMTNPVMIVSDENEHTSSIMNEYKSRGFPTLLTMKKSGMIKSYDGQRMSQEIVKSL